MFFDFLPELQRLEDAKNGNVLRAFADAEGDVFDPLRSRIAEFLDVRDPIQVRSQHDEVESFLLGPEVKRKGPIEQRGVDGTVTALLHFVSPSARFQVTDIGKEITIRKSAIVGNNKTVVVATIISPTEVVTFPSLSVDAGKLRWDLREANVGAEDERVFELRRGDPTFIAPGWLLFDGFADFETKRRYQFKNSAEEKKVLTEREGQDGTVNSSGFFVSASAAFTQKDVGKILTVAGATIDDNNGRYEIAKVVNATTVKFSSLTIRGVTSDGGVEYSAKPGKKNVRVRHLVFGPNTSQALAVDPGTEDITITLAVNGFGVLTSNAVSVAGGVNFPANESSALVVATFTGSGICAGNVSQDFMPVRGTLLEADSGPIVWSILPRAEVVLKSNAQPKGVIVREGDGAFVPAAVIIRSADFNLTSADVGRLLTIRGSTVGNDGTFTITVVDDTITLRVGLTLITEPGPLSWEIRTVPEVDPDFPADVRFQAPSLLALLAQDFGIEVDTQENEARQRSWVQNVTRWIGLKGTQKGYEIPGVISGFTVEAKQLFSLSEPLADLLPSVNRLELWEGQSGEDGSLLNVGGQLQFSAPSAAFAAHHTDSYIRISGAANSANNGLYELDSIADGQTALILLTETAVVPDANDGELTWVLLRLYTDLQPLQALMDDFVPDKLAELVDERAEFITLNVATTGGLRYVAKAPGAAGNVVSITYIDPLAASQSLSVTVVGTDISVSLATNGAGVITSTYATVKAAILANTQAAALVLIEDQGTTSNLVEPVAITNLSGGVNRVFLDMYCWEEAVLLRIGTGGAGSVSVTSVTSLGSGLFEVTTGTITRTSGTLTLYSDTVGNTLLFPKNWKFLDSTGAEFWIESATWGSPTFGNTFRVLSLTPPATGACAFDYACEVVMSCSYCGTHKIRANVIPDTIVNEKGVALEQVFERVVERLGQVTPVHVDLIVALQQTIEVPWELTVEVTSGEFLLPVVAPWTAYYDYSETIGETLAGDIIETDIFVFVV